MAVLYARNDNLLWVCEVTNGLTGAYITNATVTAQLYDNDGDTVGSQVSCAYTAGSVVVDGKTYAGGNYVGVVEEDAAITVGVPLVAHIEATATGDLVAHWEKPVTVMVRRT